MFKSIKYDGPAGDRWYHYTLIDSEFTAKFTTDCIYTNLIHQILFIVREYKKRNLNVAMNLALWYVTLPIWNRTNHKLIDKSFRYCLDNLQQAAPEKINMIREKYLEDVEKYLMLM